MLLRYFFLQRYVQPQEISTEHVKFSKVISLRHSSWWSAIYFSELYILNLTVIILSMFCTGAVETVKSCIGLSLLLANLYLQVVSFLIKRRLFLQLHTSNFSVTGFLLCVKFVKNTSKFLEFIDPFVTEIWSFMAFHGDFLIFDFVQLHLIFVIVTFLSLCHK